MYEVKDDFLRTSVALKTLLVGGDDSAQQRLRREVLLARAVSHSNVCRIFDFGRTDVLCFLTMEYLRGETLRSFLRRAPAFTVDQSLGVLSQIVAGLDAVHGADIVHRDLKSDNVFVTRDGDGQLRVVITDFGLARTDNPSLASTFRGGFKGTLTHAAPEQFMGGKSHGSQRCLRPGRHHVRAGHGGKLPVSGRSFPDIAKERLSKPRCGSVMSIPRPTRGGSL